MSKHRPSRSELRSRLRRLSATAYAWRRRVFRNTFTRRGKRYAVRRWSVKIQHRGVRRTLSLQAETRPAAAREAALLHRKIVSRGWDALATTGSETNAHARRHGGAAASADRPKAAARYWRQRLIRRPDRDPAAGSPSEFSIHIEQAGQCGYFPLGTSDRTAGARVARDIYRAIASEGWAAAWRFPRELTIGVHWFADPAAWTYFTLYTKPEAIDTRTVMNARSAAESDLPVVVVDPEPVLRTALCRCVNRQKGFVCCDLFASAAEALMALPRRLPRLVLANESIVHTGHPGFLSTLRRLAPQSPGFAYSMHEDSDQLFRATPSGAKAYLLKRTTASHFLEALGGFGAHPGPLAENLAESVRRYFETVLDGFPRSSEAGAALRLTSREQEIMALLGRGHVDKEIADLLRISAWTVHGHLKRVFQKLGVRSRTEAVVKYLQR